MVGDVIDGTPVFETQALHGGERGRALVREGQRARGIAYSQTV